MHCTAHDLQFYHIYPLGFCGAPHRNDFTSPPVHRLDKVMDWLDHITGLGLNALYLGPLFESTSHGYDTVDYYHVDRRLGCDKTLANLVRVCHERGMRVILDGVFNHAGRDFWAFQDVLRQGQNSPYKGWFAGMRFDRTSPYGDPFSYEGWNGHYNLVKFNHHDPGLRSHLFQAVRHWIEEFGIDGLRLDAADVIDHGFLQDLSSFCRGLRSDFWLLGEVVHGDYRRWANPAELDSVTNYECYKGLFSSLNDRNYFEIAYALNRQSGEGGLYRSLPLYNFVDNHDVDRVASLIQNPAHLFPLYLLLFSMPGVPSIYYGSEFGVQGAKNGSDLPLRPTLELDPLLAHSPHPDLALLIRKLSRLRQQHPALRVGDYRQLHVAHETLVFSRQTSEEWILVALNASANPGQLSLSIPALSGGHMLDVLNDDQSISVQHDRLTLDIPACWGRIILSG